MNILIANRQRTKKINRPRLKQLVSGLLAELEIDRAELGIRLVGAKEMARINQQFLRHEGSTDVITFDHRDAEDKDRKDPPQLHGELFICVDDAVAQAKKFRATWQSEIVRYVVHGVLHLVGHDDLQPAKRRTMKRAENRLVRRLTGRFSALKL